MKFWKENKLDQEFDWPVQAVADAFMVHFWASGGIERLEGGFTIERELRNWLTSKDGFNSVWEAEDGPDSFDELFEIIREQIQKGGVR